MTRGKKYKAIAEKVEKNKLYSAEEAMKNSIRLRRR
jgi:hypothetical protein